MQSAESNELYKVVFQGQILPGHDLLDVKKQLAVLFKADESKIDQLFQAKGPVVIKNNVNYEMAHKYKAAFNKAGAECLVLPLKVKNETSINVEEGKQDAPEEAKQTAPNEGESIRDTSDDNKVDNNESAQNDETTTVTYKKCPFCGEEIKESAIKCKHCKSMLDNMGNSQVSAKQEEPIGDNSKGNSNKAAYIIAGVSLIFIFLVVLGLLLHSTKNNSSQPVSIESAAAEKCDSDAVKKAVLSLVPKTIEKKIAADYRNNMGALARSFYKMANSLEGRDGAYDEARKYIKTVNLNLESIRTTDFNKDTGRYRCGADLLVIDRKGAIKKKYIINYTSEITDGGKGNYVTVHPF